MCRLRLPACVNRLLQTVQGNGFVPEWETAWLVRWLARTNTFEQTLHLKTLPLAGGARTPVGDGAPQAGDARCVPG